MTATPFPRLADVLLTDHFGSAVTPAAYLGRRALYYFGFTSCRVTCPNALARTMRALELIPPELRPQLLFVTVDPQRDDPTAMRRYVDANIPGAVGLTGDPEELARLREAMRVYARHVGAESDGSYEAPHSSFTYLFDTDGSYVTHFGVAVTAEEMSERLGATVHATDGRPASG
ncbi:MAG: SCO family protein [Pseudoclavibacter sp.]